MQSVIVENQGIKVQESTRVVENTYHGTGGIRVTKKKTGVATLSLSKYFNIPKRVTNELSKLGLKFKDKNTVEINGIPHSIACRVVLDHNRSSPFFVAYEFIPKGDVSK